MTDIEEGAEKAEKIYQRLHCAYTVERIECLEGQVWQLKNERDHWRQLALDRKDEVERLKKFEHEYICKRCGIRQNSLPPSDFPAF